MRPVTRALVTPSASAARALLQRPDHQQGAMAGDARSGQGPRPGHTFDGARGHAGAHGSGGEPVDTHSPERGHHLRLQPQRPGEHRPVQAPAQPGRADVVGAPRHRRSGALFASDRARGGAFADVRDIGIMVRGGIGSRVDFQGGDLDGVAERQNEVDRDDQKALAGNLAFRPLKGLHVGASGAWGNGGGDRLRRDRAGAEVPARPRSVHRPIGADDGPRRGRAPSRGLRPPRLPPRTAARGRAAGRLLGSRHGIGRDAVDGQRAGLRGRDQPLSLPAQPEGAGKTHVRKTFHEGILPSRNVFLINTPDILVRGPGSGIGRRGTHVLRQSDRL